MAFGESTPFSRELNSLGLSRSNFGLIVIRISHTVFQALIKNLLAVLIRSSSNQTEDPIAGNP